MPAVAPVMRIVRGSIDLPFTYESVCDAFFSHTTWYVNGNMTTPSTGARASAKLATRDALIDAALVEFIEHGPSAPSLDAICDRAGYTRGAFYVHFKDREDLLVAVMDRVLGDLVRAVGVAGQGDAGL